MSNKILLLLRKIMAILVITVFCGTGFVSASYEAYNPSTRSSFLERMINKFKDFKNNNNEFYI